MMPVAASHLPALSPALLQHQYYPTVVVGQPLERGDLATTIGYLLNRCVDRGKLLVLSRCCLSTASPRLSFLCCMHLAVFPAICLQNSLVYFDSKSFALPIPVTTYAQRLASTCISSIQYGMFPAHTRYNSKNDMKLDSRSGIRGVDPGLAISRVQRQWQACYASLSELSQRQTPKRR